jgi:uncharacterized protein (DUF2236 family)
MTAEVGYFSRESLLRRVHRECAVGILYGQRALCIGAAHPLNYVVTAIHARDRQRPFQELAWRATLIETIIFGSREDADSALAYVNKIHERVKGALPVDAGQYPAGSPYSALDPELLWTIALMADSAQYFFELFVGTLSVHEKEAFWQDYFRLGELLTLPRASAPATHAQFRDWWHERLANNSLPDRQGPPDRVRDGVSDTNARLRGASEASTQRGHARQSAIAGTRPLWTPLHG